MSPAPELLAIAEGLDLSDRFPEAVDAEVEALRRDPGIDDPTLEDLEAVPFVTIDHESSLDLDQAVHVEARGDGWLVSYALADAAHFVRPGSALFGEAVRRGASFYLPGWMIPMLPRALCQDLVSLNPDVARRAGGCCRWHVARRPILAYSLPSMPYARGAHDNRVHYRVFGAEDAPPVVLIQGLGLSGRFWFQLPEELAEAGYRVLVPDNRGTGDSELPRRPWRMGAMADDVARVLDTESVDRATVVGISMGGMIAQHVAIRHPRRTEGLVLMATTCGLPHGRLPDPATLGMLLRSPFARGAEASRNLARLLLPEHEVHRAAEHFADWPKAFAQEGRRPRTFFMQLGAVLLHSTGGRLGDIQCPTVVVHGDQDVLVPHRNGEILAKRIPTARLDSLRGVAHAIPTLDREAVRRAIEHVRGEGASRGAEATPRNSAA